MIIKQNRHGNSRYTQRDGMTGGNGWPDGLVNLYRGNLWGEDIIN